MDEVEVFKALGDPTRLKILDIVRHEEKCICDIIPKTGKSQPNVSQHLKVLRIAGLIKERKDGTRIMISISNRSIYDVIDRIKKM
jgi:ArsR family transcriptional regulator